MVEIFNPEKWGGHTFDDRCPAIPSATTRQVNISTRAAKRLLLDIPKKMPTDLLQWQDRERARAFAALSEFFESAVGSEHIKVLENGETFRLSDWPKGTIIRYERSSIDRELVVSDISRFGIIAQAKTKVGGYTDCVIDAPDEIIPSSLRELVGVSPNYYVQRLDVGRVMHWKHTGTESERDSLAQYNLFEIWKLGQVEREQVRAAGFKSRKTR